MMEAPAKALDFAESLRRLANIVRPGTVAEVDLPAARARVRYATGPDSAPVLTGWLPWMAAAAGEDRAWRPPSVGEQVLLLSPFGEMSAGWILPGAYLEAFPAPETAGAKHVMAYRDGAILAYDAAAHRLSAVLPDGGSAEITAPDGVTITGDLTVDGDIGVTGNAGVDGDVESGGAVSDQKGSMQKMRGTFNLHTHGVPPGTTVPAPNQRMT